MTHNERRNLWFGILFTVQTLLFLLMLTLFAETLPQIGITILGTMAFAILAEESLRRTGTWPPISDWCDRFSVDHSIYILEAGWDENHPRNVPHWQAVLLTYTELLTMWLGACCCHVFGHTVTSDGGWAGPDSGGDDFYCTRCGWSHRIIYY